MPTMPVEAFYIARDTTIRARAATSLVNGNDSSEEVTNSIWAKCPATISNNARSARLDWLVGALSKQMKRLMRLNIGYENASLIIK
jgi:hypothetical protein